jgi:3D (Asp-Asp-Asp) domain-containing protein
MKKTIFILILFIAIAVIAISFGVRECINLEKQRGYLSQIEEQQTRYLDNISEYSKSYNTLYADFNKLYANYAKLAADKGFYEGWEVYEATAYTSNDPGCGSKSVIGMDLLNYKDIINFCAVDPEFIAYGSTVLVKFDTGITSFVAVDCGALVKGKKIDLYFGKDVKSAVNFGVKNVEVKVIQ